MKNKYLTPAEIVKIYELSSEGLKDEDIANRLQCSISTVLKWKVKLRENGYELPSRRGRPALKIPPPSK